MSHGCLERLAVGHAALKVGEAGAVASIVVVDEGYVAHRFMRLWFSSPPKLLCCVVCPYCSASH